MQKGTDRRHMIKLCHVYIIVQFDFGLFNKQFPTKIASLN